MIGNIILSNDTRTYVYERWNSVALDQVMEIVSEKQKKHTLQHNECILLIFEIDKTVYNQPINNGIFNLRSYYDILQKNGSKITRSISNKINL